MSLSKDNQYKNDILQSNVECIFYLNIKIKLQKLLEQGKDAKRKELKTQIAFSHSLWKQNTLAAARRFIEKFQMDSTKTFLSILSLKHLAVMKHVFFSDHTS